jgi:TRAP-type C4-dicarboxylate transport system substrate-binding protein
MPDSLHAVKTGIADIVHFPIAVFPNDFPITDLINYPIILPNSEIADAWWSEMYARDLLKECEPYKVLWNLMGTPAHLYLTDKKVTSMEELKGMKIRAMGTYADMVKALGGSPVSIPTAEAYMSVERGIVDGLITVGGFYVAGKFFELCKYALDEPLAGGISMILMDRGKWDKLPADIQVIINEENLRVSSLWQAQNWDEELEGFKVAQEGGRELYSLTAEESARWRKAIEPLIDKWAADIDAKGLPGTEAVAIARHVMARHRVP